jgi:hypothetical protein
MTGYLRILTCFAIGGLATACSDSSGTFAGVNPAAPAALASSVGHALQLHAVTGEGTGIVNVTPNARGGFVANTEDVIHVRGVTPGTTLHVRAAADVGLPGGQQSDGVCQRASLGQFQPLALFPGGPPATLETSPGGSGTVHVTFGITNPAVSNGSQLDLVLRVVDALPPAVPTIDLRTDCVTLTIK